MKITYPPNHVSVIMKLFVSWRLFTTSSVCRPHLRASVLKESSNLMPQGYKPGQPVSRMLRVSDELGEVLLTFSAYFHLIFQCLCVLRCAHCNFHIPSSQSPWLSLSIRKTSNFPLRLGEMTASPVSASFLFALLPPPSQFLVPPGPNSLICFLLALSILAQLSAVSVLLISCTSPIYLLSTFQTALPSLIQVFTMSILCVTLYFKFLFFFLPPPLERRHGEVTREMPMLNSPGLARNHSFFGVCFSLDGL